MSSCDNNCNSINTISYGIETTNCTIDASGNNVLAPILVKKILGCLEYRISSVDVVNDMNFSLQDLGITYPDGGVVCIDNIVYSYDYIGLTNNPINARISCNNISMFPSGSYATTNGTDILNLYNEYLGTTNLSCCDCIDKVKFIEQSLEFYISNLVVTAQGTIGGQPFVGIYTYSGSLV